MILTIKAWNIIICFVQRIEGNQIENREQDKMWLVRHLEVTRQLVIEDLRVVKVLTETVNFSSISFF